jgi:hypothetical protein
MEKLEYHVDLCDQVKSMTNILFWEVFSRNNINIEISIRLISKKDDQNRIHTVLSMRRIG